MPSFHIKLLAALIDFLRHLVKVQQAVTFKVGTADDKQLLVCTSGNRKAALSPYLSCVCVYIAKVV